MHETIYSLSYKLFAQLRQFTLSVWHPYCSNCTRKKNTREVSHNVGKRCEYIFEILCFETSCLLCWNEWFQRMYSLLKMQCFVWRWCWLNHRFSFNLAKQRETFFFVLQKRKIVSLKKISSSKINSHEAEGYCPLLYCVWTDKWI